MANPYVVQTLTGYNSSPPPDDGSQVAANQVTWAKHKTKLTDPLKNYIDNIQTAVNTAMGTVDDASNLTTGTLDDDRLSDNVPRLDGTNAFTGTNTFGGVNVTDFARLSQSNTFTGNEQRLQHNDAFISGYSAGGTRTGYLQFDAGSSVILNSDQSGIPIDLQTNSGALRFSGDGGSSVHFQISGGGAVAAPIIATSTSTTLAAGQVHAIDGNATLPNMEAGQWVTVINNGSSERTVTKNGSDTMYWTATGSSVTSVTIPARGAATFICADGSNVYANGNITGSS